MKHTPGPWRVKNNTGKTPGSCEYGYQIIPQKGNGPIALVYYGTGVISSKETQQANAKLIAAAPEILKALQDLIFDAQTKYETLVSQAEIDDEDARWCQNVEQACAAISKATIVE